MTSWRSAVRVSYIPLLYTMNHSSEQAKKVAASLLIRSICSIFPKVKILSAGETKKGFYCDCLFTHPFDEQALRMIEEELQRSIQEGLTIESVEMMRENAATLMKHRGQEFLAEEVLRLVSNIVELIRIEDFYCICSAPLLSTTKEVGYVKLYKFSEGESIRIEGVVKEDRKSLKKFLRQLNAFKGHQQIGREAKLFEVDEDSCLWAPRGESVRSELVDWWKKAHKELGFGIIASSGAVDRRIPCFEYGDQLAEIKLDEQQETPSWEGGLFDLPVITRDKVWWALNEQNAALSLNSYLHFIKKTVNMFHIDCKWIFYTKKCKTGRSQNKWDLSVKILEKALNDSDIETLFENLIPVKNPTVRVVFTDALGREWFGPKIELCDSKEYQITYNDYSFVMIGSVFDSLETIIALLLEANDGILPDWLAPEQVRVLPVKEVDNKYAGLIVSELNASGYRALCDLSTSPLSEKVYAARMCNVPYVMIIGKKERENGTVAVNCYSEGEETRTVDLEEFKLELDRKVNNSRLFNLNSELITGEKQKFES